MNSETRLKNCPFCGSLGKIIKHGTGKYVWYYPTCSNEGEDCIASNHLCGCEIYSCQCDFRTEELAIKAWNTRKEVKDE